MAEKYMMIELATPSRKVNIGQAKSCTAPGVKGRFQVLPNHAAMVSELGIGEIKIELPEKIQYYAVSGGFLEVLNNRILLLLESAEAAQEIDVERAKSALERAKHRLKAERDKIDVVRAEAAMARALNRLRIAQKAH
jgi:F-type H+-transporting ATPase subunit epsilon